MTTREAILARLGRSPATMPELYDMLTRYADTEPGEAYTVAFREVNALIASGDVEHMADMQIYRLTEKQIPRNTKEDDE
jgi:hypothetical protein